MRKLLTLLLCGILFSNISNAQYVNLPDTNFRNYLQIKYPECFNGTGQLDTTCSSIVNEDSLTTFTWYGITDLTGLRYFKNLVYLDLSYGGYSGITVFPEIPASLVFLNCASMYNLTQLPALPPGLQHLDCNNCYQLRSLPALPASLQYLNISECHQFNTAFSSLPVSLKYFNCSRSYGMGALPALPAGLEFLDCSECFLTSLPELPASLKYFSCAYNDSVSSLPVLPSGLVKLRCDACNITSLPSLPGSLTSLSCAGNKLTSLPALPAQLDTLYCGRNLLTSLPALPASMLNLSFYFNNISNFPALPGSMHDLDCSMNPLHSIPAFPDSLRRLFCYYDSLTQLPALPPMLDYLYCVGNQLTSLPALPPALTQLYCQVNQLGSLPEIPNTINELNCSYNNIYCLPKLPSPVSQYYLHLTLDGYKINCLPNIPQRLWLEPIDTNGYYNYPNLPLCNPTNNVSHCASFPVMQGLIFYDNNSNGIRDIGEPVRNGARVSLSNNSYSFANNNGNYEIGADSIGVYALSLTPPNYFNAVPAAYNFNFSSYDTLVTNNFALQANAVVESLQITINPVNWAARPGFPFPYMINYENIGTTTVSPNIVFNYDNTRLVYDSSSNAAVTDNGSSLSLSVSNFVPGQQENFIAYFKVKTTAVIGDTLNATAILTANSNNYSTSNTVTIRGAFDPNDKQATPQLSPSQVVSGKYIDYTIRFQNTGNDTAFNIVITDTLNEDMQPATLQMISSSHNCKATVKDNIVFFEFLNILLPDSNVNELKSHGFVSFRIKPQPTVLVNTTIPNKAAIYFDYNAPVITNTAGTLIKDFTVIPLRLVSFSAAPQTDNTTTLYWNTANEINTKQFVIERGNDGLHFNALVTVTAKGRMSNNYSSSVADINNSIVYYRLKIIDNDGSFNFSPIIKIDRRKNTTGFAVLSNPVKDFIVINTNDRSLNNTTCNIINAQGAVVKSFIISQDSQAIDVKGLPNGIYYLRTVNGSSRVVIQ